MISWGLVSACMVWVSSPGSFYLLRFLLGVAEAGFVPGMLLYLTFWFPSHERARAVAKFMTATSLAGVVGGPLSSALLKLDGVDGLSGWQWLFLFEGVPTVLIGISVLFVLKDGPEVAEWLKPEERTWLKSELRAGPGAVWRGAASPSARCLQAACGVGSGWGVHHHSDWGVYRESVDASDS